MSLCYAIPYLKCPDTNIIVEGCNCIICKQHRKEWLQHHNEECVLNQKYCHHVWFMDCMFDWYICNKCCLIRRTDIQRAISPSKLEPNEWQESRRFYFKDSVIKSNILNKGNSNPKSKGYQYPDLTPLSNNLPITLATRCDQN